MTKGERTIRRELLRYPGADLVKSGRAGFVVVYNGKRFPVGGLQSGDHDRHGLRRFLEGRGAS